MKGFLKYITAICMSALVLLSTISFTVDMHYCGKHLVDIAFNDDARGCGMAMDSKQASGKGDLNSDPCCADILLAFDGREDLKSASHQYNLEKQAEFLTQEFISVIARPEVRFSIIPYRDYFPPPIIQDFPILYQSFLI